MISFRCGKTKVWVLTQERAGTSKQLTPLYAEWINMLNGLVDEEVDQYLKELPKIVLLFKVDVSEAVTPYINSREEDIGDPDPEAIRELRKAQEAFENKMVVL